jgi:hypothetical protein
MSFWRAVDWAQPWLAPYRDDGAAVCAALEAGDTVAQALDAAARGRRPKLQAGEVHFVAHSELPEGIAYEAFIARAACVPTRDNLHDLFNGLVWMRFPALKRRLNELQAAQIEQTGVASTRGSVRDALTLFDENAAIWRTDGPMFDALRSRDWTSLFIERRAEWSRTEVILFGHALLEKLVVPRKPITAHVWCVPLEADLDSFVANELHADRLVTKPWLPLPVLGIPGWWSKNEAPGFYKDDAVFRGNPLRHS